MMKPIVLLGDTRDTAYLQVIEKERFGIMFVERPPKIHYEGMPWAFDNGCFGAWWNREVKGKADYPSWDAAVWHTRALRIRTLGIPSPLFAVVPDLPSKGKDSLDFSYRYLDMVPSEFPKALATQDGQTFQDIIRALKDYDWLFIGGENRWKLKAADLTRLGHDHGKKVHYGRASTEEKVEWAIHCGVDSLDTSFSVVGQKSLQALGRYFCERTSQLCPVPEIEPCDNHKDTP